MLLGNLKVGTRLSLGFGIMLAFLVGSTLLGIANMATIENRLNEIVNDNVHKMELCQQMSNSVHIVARVTRTVVLLTDEEAKKREYAKIEAARQQYDKAWEALQKLSASEAGKALRTRIAEAKDKARPLNSKVIELGFANRDAEAISILMQEAGPATQQWQDLLHENIVLQEENNKKDAEAAATAYTTAHAWMLALSGIAVVLVLYQSSNDGYNFLSLIRASSVLNCQSVLTAR